MPLKTISLVAPAGPSVDDIWYDGTLHVFKIWDGVNWEPYPAPGTLGATAWVVASNASAKIKAFASILQASGYPVWVCDGTADQTEINAAIAALTAASGTVQLSEGTFYIATPIIIDKDRVSLKGMGYGAASLFLVNAANCDIITGVAASTCRFKINISGIFFDGNKAGNASGSGIAAYWGQSIFSDCYFYNMPEWAIKVLNPAAGSPLDNRFQRLQVDGPVTGSIWGSSGSDYQIFDSVFGGGTYGINIEGPGTIVKGCHFYGQTIAAMYFHNVAQKIRIASNEIENLGINAHGIYLYAENGYIISTLIANNLVWRDGVTTGTGCGIYCRRVGGNWVYGGNILGNSITQMDYEIDVGGTYTKEFVIANNTLEAGRSGVITGTLDSTMSIWNNKGYIAPGEIRTISGTLAGVTPAGIMLSVDNPFGQAVRVLSVDIEVTTQGAAGGRMCVGIGPAAANDYETMFAQLPTDPGASYPYFYNSTIGGGVAVQTNAINWATGAGNRYLNFYAHVANAAFVATHTIRVMGN